MPTKQCTGCQAVKPLTGFARKKNLRDGRDTRCKACRLAYMREYYTRRFGRSRPRVPEGHKYCPRCKRILALAGFLANAARPDGRQVYCAECWRELQRYGNLPAVSRRRRIERTVGYHRRDPIKQRARLYVALAIHFGDLKRKPCEACGVKAVQAHHDDYSKPLTVRWLCGPHHDALHPHEQPGHKMAPRQRKGV